ncbi:MAG: TerC family protein [Planctomycetaceae bacterium]
MDWISQPEGWIAFLTLTTLELVLGVDNVIFISILAGKLPEAQRPKARNFGLGVAVVSRILLLLSLSWVIGLTDPLFAIAEFQASGRDLILFLGGLFLLAKSTREIHLRLEGEEGHAAARIAPSLSGVLLQVFLLDLVFSLDSVITAVGMVDRISIMVSAILVSAAVMIAMAGRIGRFVDRHPTVKMLALSFLLLIGFTLVVEGLHHHIPKGYIYFAMGFSVFVEALNLRTRKPVSPVKLRDPYSDVRGNA